MDSAQRIYNLARLESYPSGDAARCVTTPSTAGEPGWIT